MITILCAGHRAFFKDFPVGGHFLKKDLSQAFCEILK